jgi:hypothetical protein
MKAVNTFSITKTAEELVPDTVSRTGYLVAVFITLILFVLIIVVWGKLPRTVPLYFSEPWGDGRLASREWLFLLPGLSLLTITLNVILGKLGGSSSPLLPRMLGVTAGIVSLTLLLSLVGIVQSLTL